MSDTSAITRALVKLVRDHDRWKRLAQDRAPVRSADRKREIQGRDEAVRQLLLLVTVEGNGLSSCGRSCIWDAVKALRPDVYKAWWDDGGDSEAARRVRRRFFPTPDDLAASDE
jgi:hypothetical protein